LGVRVFSGLSVNIKLHRLKVGSSGSQSFGYGSTWVVGGAILLCAFSLTMFSAIGTSNLFLLLNIPILVLFYLTNNFSKLHYVLGYLCGLLGIYFLFIATPDFFSSSKRLASHGVYHYLIGMYYIGVAFVQYKVVNKNSNKLFKRDS
jgi:hypothetical protein